jgi:hypothetical protein
VFLCAVAIAGSSVASSALPTYSQQSLVRTLGFLPAMQQPGLPSFGWAHQPTTVQPVVTQAWTHLDAFKVANPGLSKPALLLRYLTRIPDTKCLSPLLMAELTYLFFAEEECPLIYDADIEHWFLFEARWSASKGKHTRVKALLQKSLLPAVSEAAAQAQAQHTFPRVLDEQHPRLEFLHKMVSALSSARSVENLLTECAMFFDRPCAWDENPDLFQLANCVLDLQSNQFRRTRASDMCQRASTVQVPEAWLIIPALIEGESRACRTEAWDVLWSIFNRCSCQKPTGGQAADASCSCPFHPDDNYEQLGDQDSVNFHFLVDLLARLLEGRAFAKCVYLYSKRGRNSKGLLEKMIMAIFGDYYVPVKANIFLENRRNENEHSAADAFRKGARVGFANEVGTTPWANSEFKNRNSTDPSTVRGCGSRLTERQKQLMTFMFGTNDPPVFEKTPKGSELDRTLILYLPNHYKDKGANPSSPRTFPKDMSLEERVSTPTFALGLFLNLVQVRLTHAAAGDSLSDIVAMGTPTSRFWLDRWTEFWSQASPIAETVTQDLTAKVSLCKQLHTKWLAAGNNVIFGYTVGDETLLGKSKKNRWTVLEELIHSTGGLGHCMFRISTCTSRKGRLQPCVYVTRFDMDIYDTLFADGEVFGDMAEYTFNDKADERAARYDLVDDDQEIQEDVDGPVWVSFGQATEVVNLVALVQRESLGPEVTGERRQDQLQAWIQLLADTGKPVSINNLSLDDCAESPFWMTTRDYAQRDGHGAAWLQGGPGIQPITRESRSDAFLGLAVGEIDLKCAAMQCIARRVRQFTVLGEAEHIVVPLDRYENNSEHWRAAVGDYYEIGTASKAIFTRLHSGGSLRPDADSPRKNDVLPCLLQLRGAVEDAHDLLAIRDPLYMEIRDLARVQAKPNPRASGWAIYVQHLMSDAQKEVRDLVRSDELVIMGYVFDSLYVLAPSMESLTTSFDALSKAASAATGLKLSLKSATGESLHGGRAEEVEAPAASDAEEPEALGPQSKRPRNHHRDSDDPAELHRLEADVAPLMDLEVDLAQVMEDID